MARSYSVSQDKDRRLELLLALRLELARKLRFEALLGTGVTGCSP